MFGQKKPEDDQPKVSKKKLRKMNRLSVAELKQVNTFVKQVNTSAFEYSNPAILIGRPRN